MREEIICQDWCNRDAALAACTGGDIAPTLVYGPGAMSDVDSARF